MDFSFVFYGSILTARLPDIFRNYVDDTEAAIDESIAEETDELTKPSISKKYMLAGLLKEFGTDCIGTVYNQGI